MFIYDGEGVALGGADEVVRGVERVGKRGVGGGGGGRGERDEGKALFFVGFDDVEEFREGYGKRGEAGPFKLEVG